jgi:hypothetical protein
MYSAETTEHVRGAESKKSPAATERATIMDELVQHTDRMSVLCAAAFLFPRFSLDQQRKAGVHL